MADWPPDVWLDRNVYEDDPHPRRSIDDDEVESADESDYEALAEEEAERMRAEIDPDRH